MMEVHYVIVDTRETQEVRDAFRIALTEMGVEVREEACQPTGDIRIVYGRGSAVLFERKERLDGIHSWQSGHLDDQVGRMLETGDDVELIIEGDLYETVIARGKNVLKLGPVFGAQLKYYNRLMPVRKTKDLAHTVDWVCDTIKAIRSGDYRAVQRKYRLEHPTMVEEIVNIICKKAKIRRVRRADLAKRFRDVGDLVDIITRERYVRMYEPLRWAIYYNPWHDGLLSLEQALKFEEELFKDAVSPVHIRGLGPKCVELVRAHWPSYLDFISYLRQQPKTFMSLSVGGLSSNAKERILAIAGGADGHPLAGFGPHVKDSVVGANAHQTYGNR